MSTVFIVSLACAKEKTSLNAAVYEILLMMRPQTACMVLRGASVFHCNCAELRMQDLPTTGDVFLTFSPHSCSGTQAAEETKDAHAYLYIFLFFYLHAVQFGTAL